MISNLDLACINDKAVKKVVYDQFVKLYKSQVEDDPEKFFSLHVEKEAAMAFDMQLSAITNDSNNRYQSNIQLTPQKTVALFVTFAPEDDAVRDWSKIIKKVIKPNKGVKKIYAVIEQRSEDLECPDIHGIHMHILYVLDKDDQNGQLARQAKRVRSMLEQYRTQTDHFLDIKRVSQEKLDDKISYIYGKKTDETKHAKLLVDTAWREQMRYPQYWVL